MPNDAKPAFYEFEAEADARLETLALSDVSLRALLAHYHFKIFYFLHFEGAKDASARRSAETSTYRLSYLLDWLADRKLISANLPAARAEKVVRNKDPEAKDLTMLDAYAHFCEVVPEVRRGKLEVKSVKGGFGLKVPAEFARAEATDVLVSELAISHISPNEPKSINSRIKSLADGGLSDWSLLRSEAISRIDKYYVDVREDPVISDEALAEVFGFSWERFREIRGAIYALAEVYQELAIASYITNSNSAGDPSDETVDLISISWPESTLIDRLTELAGGDRNEVARFVDTFTFDPESAKRRGGEGYTPPFTRIHDHSVFCSDLIFRFIQPRNAVQDLMRLDKKRFDNIVSKSLEPTLIGAAVDAVSGFPSLKVAISTKYELGEIDLMLVDPASEDVIIIEVKGPLPPQGSRGTERLAQRVREGVEQINTFRSLDETGKLDAVETGIGLRLKNPRFQYMVLARSCVGAVELWNDMSVVQPATLPLLRLALGAIEKRKGDVAAELSTEIQRQTAELLKECKWSWSIGKMRLLDKVILTPQLRYDEKVMESWLRRADGERA